MSRVDYVIFVVLVGIGALVGTMFGQAVGGAFLIGCACGVGAMMVVLLEESR